MLMMRENEAGCDFSEKVKSILQQSNHLWRLGMRDCNCRVGSCALGGMK
jgi:hypothetical protein